MRISDLVAMVRTRAHREEIYSRSEYWDSKALEYDGSKISMWPNAHLNAHYHKEQVRWLFAQLPDVSGKQILDLGCGTGRMSRLLAERGAIVVGADFAPRVIEVARRLTSGSNPSFRVESVFELTEEQTYDLVLTWGVLTVACRTSEELLDALSRIRTTLRPGGKLLMMEPIHRGFLHRVLNMGVREFVETLRQAGLERETITCLHFWPARLALAYVPWPQFVTTPVYEIGEGVLALLGRKAMGDYRGIVARRSDDWPSVKERRG